MLDARKISAISPFICGGLAVFVLGFTVGAQLRPKTVEVLEDSVKTINYLGDEKTLPRKYGALYEERATTQPYLGGRNIN